jgi:hypothetical protein
MVKADSIPHKSQMLKCGHRKQEGKDIKMFYQIALPKKYAISLKIKVPMFPYNPSYSGGRGRRILSLRLVQANIRYLVSKTR